MGGMHVVYEREKLRKSLGVCPQFDTVYGTLIVGQHISVEPIESMPPPFCYRLPTADYRRPTADDRLPKTLHSPRDVPEERAIHLPPTSPHGRPQPTHPITTHPPTYSSHPPTTPPSDGIPAKKQLELHAQLSGMTHDQAEKEAVRLLTAVGLAEKMNQAPGKIRLKNTTRNTRLYFKFETLLYTFPSYINTN